MMSVAESLIWFFSAIIIVVYYALVIWMYPEEMETKKDFIIALIPFGWWIRAIVEFYKDLK